MLYQLVLLFCLIIGAPRNVIIYTICILRCHFFSRWLWACTYSIDKPWNFFETASHIFWVLPHYYVINYYITINIMIFFFFMSTRMFVESCKRLRIMKGKEAIGLGLGKYIKSLNYYLQERITYYIIYKPSICIFSNSLMKVNSDVPRKIIR